MLVTKMIMPLNKYNIKCPYTMDKVEGITIHNTANDASAMAEISYMMGNNNYTSFHEAIDDYRVVQGIEHNRNGYHASDGIYGFGNRKTIGIEICYSKSGGERYEKAVKNAIERIAYLMKIYGLDLSAIEDKRVGTHQDRSGKYCPHRILDSGIDNFYNLIKEEYNRITNTNEEIKEETSLKYKVNDKVKINGVYSSSSSMNRLIPLLKEGVITKIVLGAKNPYLLNSGNIGWINNSCIVSNIKEEVKTTDIKVNGRVKLLNTAYKYVTGEIIPNGFKNREYTVYQENKDKVLLKELWSWVWKKDLQGYEVNKTQNKEANFNNGQIVNAVNLTNKYLYIENYKLIC